jgi:hypothetical protein
VVVLVFAYGLFCAAEPELKARIDGYVAERTADRTRAREARMDIG